MKRITIPNIKSPKDIDKYRSQVIDELLSNPSVVDFLHSNNLDENFIDSNIVGLIQIKEDNEPCINCPGYSKCKRNPKGYKTTMLKDSDGDYTVSYAKCDKYIEIEPLLNAYDYRDFDEEWLKASLENVSINLERRKVITAAIALLKENSKIGLYIHGKSGVGKSFVCAALVNDLIKIYNYKASFVNVRSFIEDCKSTFETKSNYTNDRIKELQDIDVLVLDDLGGEKISEWSTFSVLQDIIESRIRNKKLTIYTSLYDYNDLVKAYGGHNLKTNRFIDTIRNSADELEMSGVNLNRIK